VTTVGRRGSVQLILPWSSRAVSTAADAVPRITPLALFSSASIPIVLTTGWLVADTLQRPSYSPMRQTVSVLSGDAGIHPWLVTAALYWVGLAYVVTAAGMRDLATEARTGLLVAATAAIGLATFPVPVHGTSRPHAVCVAIGSVAIAVWPALVARQEAVRAAVGSRLSNAAIVVSTGLFLWTAMEVRDGPLLGLAERVSSGLQVAWPFVVALQLRRAQLRHSRQGESGRSVAQLAG
jgi:hypothetical membrane protein